MSLGRNCNLTSMHFTPQVMKLPIVANSCQSAATCWGAQSEIDMKGTAILLLSVRGGGIEDLNHSSGTLEAHEFTHAIQGSQFIGTSKEAAAYCCTKSYMPWWLVEGGAEFSQAAALYSDSFANYTRNAKMMSGDCSQMPPSRPVGLKLF